MSQSSAEADYRSIATTTVELLWLHGLLSTLCIVHSQPMAILCDNQATLQIAANPVLHERTKHIEIDCHFIYDHLCQGSLMTSYVPSVHQLADIFTKALGNDRFLFLLYKLGILDIHVLN